MASSLTTYAPSRGSARYATAMAVVARGRGEEGGGDRRRWLSRNQQVPGVLPGIRVLCRQDLGRLVPHSGVVALEGDGHDRDQGPRPQVVERQRRVVTHVGVVTQQGSPHHLDRGAAGDRDERFRRSLSHEGVVAIEGSQENLCGSFRWQSVERQSRLLSHARIVTSQRLNEEVGYAGWFGRGLRLDLPRSEQTEGNDDDGRMGGTNQLCG